MRVKLIGIFFICLFNYGNSYSTHIVGGEFNYECLGNNNYRLKLKIYRDCSPGTTAYDNPAFVTIFDLNGTVLQTLQLPFPGSVVLPPTINNPCFPPPTNICVQEAIYTQVVNLPPIAGGYTFAYQRCCRNNSILNVNNPGNTGSTYTAHIPGPNLADCNSNPYYNYFPPIYLCTGVPLNFDHSATDIDGDSLVYSLCDPYDGASYTNTTPDTASPPPFSYIPFNNPYNGGYPLSSLPALSIHPQTGLLTGIPNMIGQWVVGVCVREYRNGVFLSENKRDFQFNVVNCPGMEVANFEPPPPQCAGIDNNFNFTAGGNFNSAATFNWSFGPDATPSSSNLQNPSGIVFNATGTFPITLIVSQSGCIDTVSKEISVYAATNADFSYTSITCSSEIVFDNSSIGANAFLWDFGDSTNSTEAFPKHLYLQAGNHLVTLVVSSPPHCYDTVSYIVESKILEKWPVELPNVFSPNGDGMNDLFRPLQEVSCFEYDMRVYNRWGNLIFYTSSPLLGYWDGKIGKDNPVPEGVYYYIFERPGFPALRGFVQILR